MIEDNVKIELIEFCSNVYHKELIIRDAELRKPLGLSLFDEDLSGEDRDYHVGAFLNEEIVGVLLLTKLDNKEIKMRQVAVAAAYQGKGIGKLMVIFSEALVKYIDYDCIVLNARETVIPFYQKLGYEVVSEKFFEVGIPHFKMQKSIK